MAGAPCPIETMKQVMDKMYCKEIISVYGLTEASPGMTASRVTDSMEIRATTVGCAFPNVEVKVLDPATNKECPPGTPGEMCCKGYNIMKGYYKNPEATAAIIDENGFLHSGDLGVMDENGYFRITGRIKEMIIRGGENIYPREIENFLYSRSGRHSEPEIRRGGRSVHQDQGGKLADRGRSKTVLPGTDRTLQKPEIHLLRRRLSDDRQRQDSEIQAEGRRSPSVKRKRSRSHLIENCRIFLQFFAF